MCKDPTLIIVPDIYKQPINKKHLHFEMGMHERMQLSGNPLPILCLFKSQFHQTNGSMISSDAPAIFTQAPGFTLQAEGLQCQFPTLIKDKSKVLHVDMTG